MRLSFDLVVLVSVTPSVAKLVFSMSTDNLSDQNMKSSSTTIIVPYRQTCLQHYWVNQARNLPLTAPWISQNRWLSLSRSLAPTLLPSPIIMPSFMGPSAYSLQASGAMSSITFVTTWFSVSPPPKTKKEPRKKKRGLKTKKILTNTYPASVSSFRPFSAVSFSPHPSVTGMGGCGDSSQEVALIYSTFSTPPVMLLSATVSLTNLHYHAKYYRT